MNSVTKVVFSQMKALLRAAYRECAFIPTRMARKLIARKCRHQLSAYQLRRLRVAAELQRRRVRYGFAVRTINRIKRIS